jgi:hypothetical protein
VCLGWSALSPWRLFPNEAALPGAALGVSVLDRLYNRTNPLTNLRKPEFLVIHRVCDEVVGRERIQV